MSNASFVHDRMSAQDLLVCSMGGVVLVSSLTNNSFWAGAVGALCFPALVWALRARERRTERTLFGGKVVQLRRNR